jgi:hypothetical protein
LQCIDEIRDFVDQVVVQVALAQHERRYGPTLSKLCHFQKDLGAASAAYRNEHRNATELARVIQKITSHRR